MEACQRLSEEPLRTVVIGAGNVASHIVPALERTGSIDVCAVWSRTEEHARELASALNHATYTDDMAALPSDAELYLVSVADDMVSRIADLFAGGRDAIWLHTSGSVDASALSGITPHYGVLYPLQTFTRGAYLDVSRVPFFIEGHDELTYSTATALARSVSERVYPADSVLRARMHVAAVFACNFTNYMWSVADRMLARDAGLDISVLEPLLHETLRKAMAIGPAASQTGPARRGDRRVIDKHMSMLPADERELYEFITEKIISEYERNQL
ncbi:MAG: F420-dependent NADP oxidoreductase [Muribaculaceae bacterium]|nr:F420-dependent NADP oxidoreductase [Muribaculaceae bacterium]